MTWSSPSTDWAVESPFSAGVSPAPAGLVVGLGRSDRGSGGAAPAVAPSSIRAIDRADRDVVAFLDQLLGQHARDRRGHLDADLVGLEAGDRLVGLHRFAGLLQPLGERAFGDRFPERRDLDVGGHALPLLRRDRVRCAAAMAERRGNQGRLLGRVPLGEPGRRRSGRRRGPHSGPHAGKPASARHCSIEARRRTRRRCSTALPAPRRRPRGSASRWRRLTSGSDGNGYSCSMRTISTPRSPAGVTRFHQLIGELARAQDQPPSLAVRRRVEIRQDSAEVAFAGEVGRARYRELVPKQRLGRHHDQRLAEAAPHLPPQDVEIIGRASCSWRPGDCPRRRAAGSAPAARELCSGPCPSNPCGRSMTRPLARSHLASPAATNWSMMLCAPLAKSPNCASHSTRRLRVRERIAIFEAEHAELAERAVADLEAAAALDMAERNVLLAGLLVDPHRVALAERPAAAVLAGEANALPFRDQAAEGERFRRRPVESLAALEHRLLGVEDALKRLVNVHVGRDGRQDLAESLEHLVADRGVDVAAAEHRLVRAGEAGPAAFEPVGLVRKV